MAEVNKLNKVVYNKLIEQYGQGKYISCIELGKVLLEKARMLGDQISEMKALEVLSYSSYYVVDYLAAMTYIIQFSKMMELEGTVAERIKINFLFISVYTRQGEYEEAKKLLDITHKLAKENDLYLELIKTENNYGFFYNTAGDFNKSIPHLEEALKLSEQYHFLDIYAVVLGNLSLAYLRTGRIAKAKRTLDEVFLTLKGEERGVSISEAYMYRGEIFGLEGDYEEAISQIKVSMMISHKHGYTAELAEAHRLLSDVYVKQGDYKRAYETVVESLPLQRELSEKAKEGALIKLKMQYDLNKKDVETDVLRKQNATLEAQNKKIQEQTREVERLNSVLGRQNDDLHQAAIEDYLTGIYNRRYYTLKMQEEFSIAKEKHSNLACIVFDIDRFKKINDTYGHLVGDEVIKHVSSICEQSLDSDSIIGRFGGDEFMILMVDATIDDAEDKANELIQNILLEPLIIDKKPISVTLSLGVSDNHFNSPRTTDEMIATADKGLYVAKESGRNKCCRMEL